MDKGVISALLHGMQELLTLLPSLLNSTQVLDTETQGTTGKATSHESLKECGLFPWEWCDLTMDIAPLTPKPRKVDNEQCYPEQMESSGREQHNPQNEADLQARSKAAGRNPLLRYPHWMASCCAHPPPDISQVTAAPAYL